MTSLQQGANGAEMKIDHEFKSHPDVFWPAASGEKPFEYRRDDRGGYEVGQTVRLRCFDPAIGYVDVPPLDRRITNILRGGEFELPPGYCILGLAPLSTDAETKPAGDPVTILYTNWRQETGPRTIIPNSSDPGFPNPWFGSTEWHPEPQYLLSAWDIEKGAYRDFAMADIKAWGQANVDAALSASPRTDGAGAAAGDLLRRSDVMAACAEMADRTADMALYGEPEQAQRREAMEATATRLKATFQHMPAALSPAPAAGQAGAVPDSLRALSEAASQGEWVVGDIDVESLCTLKNGNLEEHGNALPWDASFIVASVNFVRSLIAAESAETGGR